MNRSPAVAGVLAVLFPGLGHLFTGANRRALALAAMCAALLHGVIEGDGGPVVAALPALWLFSIVNAVRIADEMGRAAAGGRAAEPALDNRWSAALVVAGVLAVLSAIPEARWLLNLWPLLLVWTGIQRLRKQPLLPWIGSGAEAADGVAPAATAAPETAAKAPPAPATGEAGNAGADSGEEATMTKSKETGHGTE